MPSRLEALQRLFTSSAFGDADPAFVAAVRGGGRLTAAQAVEVYRGGYTARLAEALGETFEACWRVLGDEDFLGACRDFARSVPSASHNLSDYGETFPAFLERRFAAEAPGIGDLGRLEWRFKELFHAPVHHGLPPESLATAGPASRLRLGSAAELLSFPHAVHAIWRRDRSDETPLSAADWTGPESLILYKNRSSAVFSRVLSSPELAALSALRAGRPLSDALAESPGLDEPGARDLFSFIARAGLVVEVL